MTNGEKIQTILDVDRDCTEVHGDNGTTTFTVTLDFWNAEYKEPNKSEIPTGSNTKNDLGIDCISRADVNRIICEYRDDAAETGSERDLERAYGANAVGALISKLPSVTPQEPKTGTWITSFHGFPSEPYTACSNCDYDIDFEISKLVKADAFTIKPYRPKFCPNCGAEMRSENDSN